MRDKYEQSEKIDGKELIEKLKKIPKKEQEKIYYIIQGASLVTSKGSEEHE